MDATETNRARRDAPLHGRFDLVCSTIGGIEDIDAWMRTLEASR